MSIQQKFNRVKTVLDNGGNNSNHLPALKNLVSNFEEGNLKCILLKKYIKLEEKWN